jgi:hypothetical protein
MEKKWENISEEKKGYKKKIKKNIHAVGVFQLRLAHSYVEKEIYR